MSRPVTTLAVFFLSFNLFAGMLMSTGVAATIGLDTRVGGGEAVRDARQTGQDVETGAPTGETLFGAYNVLSNQLGTIFGIIFPGLRMLYNSGVPAFLVGGPSTVGLLPPLFSTILAIDIISFFRGWGL